MTKPKSIKGRGLVGAIWYYSCHCGEPGKRCLDLAKSYRIDHIWYDWEFA